MASSVTKQEEQWQAESDARTIMEAEAIKADEKRFNKAVAAAKKMKDEEEEKIKALKQLANANMNYSKTSRGDEK